MLRTLGASSKSIFQLFQCLIHLGFLQLRPLESDCGQISDMYIQYAFTYCGQNVASYIKEPGFLSLEISIEEPEMVILGEVKFGKTCVGYGWEWFELFKVQMSFGMIHLTHV